MFKWLVMDGRIRGLYGVLLNIYMALIVMVSAYFLDDSDTLCYA